METTPDGNACCGCILWIVIILFFWTLWFGLPSEDKKWNIDIFPPRIWDMNAAQDKLSVPAPLPATTQDVKKD